ncbi:MAG: hypothetical protein QM754_08025 [Tepidisphaeraceae bacterium]
MRLTRKLLRIARKAVLLGVKFTLVRSFGPDCAYCVLVGLRTTWEQVITFFKSLLSRRVL